MKHINRKIMILRQTMKIIKSGKIENHFVFLSKILHKLETPHHFIKDIASIKINRNIILNKLNNIVDKYEQKYFRFGNSDSAQDYKKSKKDKKMKKTDKNHSTDNIFLLSNIPDKKIFNKKLKK